MRPPKIVINGSVLFITASIEQGILLPCNPVMKRVFESILARAQDLYPVRVNHLILEGTHVHMIVTVDNPNDIRDFMRYFKGESAHAINAFLGRKKRTVWCAGYDSPVLLTKDAVIDKLVYLYTNPAKDALVSSIKHYPGVSTWQMFTENRHSIRRNWLTRPHIRRIAHRRRLLPYKDTDPCCVFSIHPNAWMDCLQIAIEERRQVNRSIIAMIAEKEQSHLRERQAQGRGVIGKDRLMRQWFDTDYMPQRTGRRSWCISTDASAKKNFIDWVKEQLALARAVYKRWLLGDYSLPYPVGFYPPSLPKKAELLLSALPC
jgi:REP element-mobilizing transposase RayT